MALEFGVRQAEAPVFGRDMPARMVDEDDEPPPPAGVDDAHGGARRIGFIQIRAGCSLVPVQASPLRPSRWSIYYRNHDHLDFGII
jgi:hypothetical protein